MKKNIQELQAEDHRRDLVWFLLYDNDYQLSETMLHQCFEAKGKGVSYDQIKTHAHWLCEQGLVINRQTRAGTNHLRLTDRGLDVAKGIVRAVGVRDLRPSEHEEIKKIKVY